MDGNTKQITYRFTLDDGSAIEYSVVISDRPPPLAAVESDAPEPAWTHLAFHQCADCRFAASDRCPVAQRLVEPLALLGRLSSFTVADIAVATPERNYHRHTDVQTGVSGLFGLIMATSGCPTMEPFRTMAWYHLPFATPEETFFRLAAVRLLSYHFSGKAVDSASLIEDIGHLYAQVQKVNEGMIDRLRAAVAAQADAPYNAIVMLDSVGRLLPITAEEQLAELRQLVDPRT